MSDNESPLQRAQKGLRISDVYMRSSALSVSQTYEHRSIDVDALQSQFRHLVEKSEVLVEDDGGNGQKLFRVFVDLGFRWGFPVKEVDGPVKAGEAEDGDAGDFDELGRIEAKFVAEYEMAEDLPRECLDAFALLNASYHVWPYWREYVTSSCARMNVPKLVMPTMQPAQNKNTIEAD